MPGALRVGFTRGSFFPPEICPAFRPRDQTTFACVSRRSMLLIAVQPRFSTIRWKVLSFFVLPCYPSASSMVVRPVVLQDPPKHPFPGQLPFYNHGRLLNPFKSTLTSHPASVHSKRLTATLTPFDATLTKNRGRDTSPSPEICQLVTTSTAHKPDTTVTNTSPASPSLSIACAHFPPPIGGGVPAASNQTSPCVTDSPQRHLYHPALPIVRCRLICSQILAPVLVHPYFSDLNRFCISSPIVA